MSYRKSLSELRAILRGVHPHRGLDDALVIHDQDASESDFAAQHGIYRVLHLCKRILFDHALHFVYLSK